MQRGGGLGAQMAIRVSAVEMSFKADHVIIQRDGEHQRRQHVPHLRGL